MPCSAFMPECGKPRARFFPAPPRLRGPPGTFSIGVAAAGRRLSKVQSWQTAALGHPASRRCRSSSTTSSRHLTKTAGPFSIKVSSSSFVGLLLHILPDTKPKKLSITLDFSQTGCCPVIEFLFTQGQIVKEIL
ncbi:uncharacterized protein LOC142567736 isoform X1 [Dermacentor variabilis]|uniref:uncharacterized protein LOC142567736 isoform X1 n=1 Tax=Dermacentor variabilis TaxID=34621 RepID=UPI003F5C7567